MKKYLPINSFGYTLIELMVVVAIIAILSLIGISLYTAAQSNARDGIRRAEITSLAKSIEVAKDPTKPDYKYTLDNYRNDYPQNTPKDPLKLPGGPQYCLATSTSAVPTNPTKTDWAAENPCPTDYYPVVNDIGNWSSSTLESGVKYWNLCARLENGNDGVFCQNSIANPNVTNNP